MASDSGVRLPADAARIRARVEQLVGRLHLADPSAVETLMDAYDVTYRLAAPFMVRIADDMLGDFRLDVETGPPPRFAFLGRDGHSLAVAIAQLSPRFFRAHCSQIVLSRALAENALQDLERHQGKQFPAVARFRRVAARIDPSDTVGAYSALSDYLQAAGLPADRPGARVTLIDTSYKGTVQELLSAVYPTTEFQGRYAFFGESPHDPHPGSKKGYEIHLSRDESNGGLPVNDLPADESKTFSHQVAIGTIEETLHGALSSPVRIRDGRPEQNGLHSVADDLLGLDLGKVSPRLRAPGVREAVKSMNLLAVHDRARAAAVSRDQGGDYRRDLEAGARRYRAEVRSWIGTRTADPLFTEFMNAFVRHTDKEHAASLACLLERRGVSRAESANIWGTYGRFKTDDDRSIFVENIRNAQRIEGGDHGRGERLGPRPGRGLARDGRTERDV